MINKILATKRTSRKKSFKLPKKTKQTIKINKINPSLKGLSREIDLKNVVKNLQN
jgi:hypothetical protein